MSEERGQEAFIRSMRAWADSLAQNEGNYKFGYADIEGEENVLGETVS